MEQPMAEPAPVVENPMVPPIQPVAPVGGMPGVGMEQPMDSFETPMMVSSIPDIPSLDNSDVVNQPVPSNDVVATVNDFDIVNKYYNGEQVDVNQVKDNVSKLQSLIDKVNDKINLALVNNSSLQNDMNYVQQPEMINPIPSVNEMVPSMESTINVTPPSVDFNNVIPSNDMNNNSAPMMTPGQEQIIPVDLPPVIMPDGMSSQQNGMSFPNANLGNPDQQQH
jgi:hypothetical protein